jgi:hypothetical protein
MFVLASVCDHDITPHTSPSFLHLPLRLSSHSFIYPHSFSKIYTFRLQSHHFRLDFRRSAFQHPQSGNPAQPTASQYRSPHFGPSPTERIFDGFEDATCGRGRTNQYGSPMTVDVVNLETDSLTGNDVTTSFVLPILEDVNNILNDAANLVGDLVAEPVDESPEDTSSLRTSVSFSRSCPSLCKCLRLGFMAYWN